MLQSYKTILKMSEATVVEKKSKFIATIAHVETEEQASDFINYIKSKHYDARHNVFAYVLLNDNVKRYSDDGEPQGTSGIPSLNILEAERLVNVCVVITRYFGGVLLGTGGLVRAYSSAVKEAILNSDVVTAVKCNKISLKCDYSMWGRVENILNKFEVLVLNNEFGQEIFVTACIITENFSKLTKEITEKTANSVKIDFLEEEFQFANNEGKLVKI